MNTDKLKELALAATAGEWWIDSHGHSLISHQEGGNVQLVFTTDDNMGPAVRNQETGNLSHWPNDHDASYIAAANPVAILALIAQRDELLATLKEVKADANYHLLKYRPHILELIESTIIKTESSK